MYTMDCMFVSDQSITVEETWVNVAEGAEITGYHPDHVRRLARENGRLSEEQRFIQIRKDSSGYAIWLPDLMRYVKGEAIIAPSDMDPQMLEEGWVTTNEAAQLTSYNRQYLMKLAQKMTQQAEEKPKIKVRRRNGYEFWLPDLVAYIEDRGHGPQRKRTGE